MNVLSVIFPIVAIALAGYLARKFDLLSEKENEAVEKVTFFLLMPCLLFLGTATAEFPEQMHWNYMLGFYGGVVMMYLCGILLGRFAFGYNLREQSVYGMGCAYSNVTILGIPITLQVLGEAAFVPLFLVIAIHNLFQFAFGTVVAELHRENGTSVGRQLLKSCKGLLRNPIISSLLAGGAYNILGLPHFLTVFSALDLLGRAAVPMALFVVGCSLTRYRISGDLLPSVVMVTAKLLVFPVLMYALMFHILDVEPLWAATAVLLSSMPVGISVYVFARQYHSCEPQAAAGIVLSSLLAVASLSGVAYVLQSQV